MGATTGISRDFGPSFVVFRRISFSSAQDCRMGRHRVLRGHFGACDDTFTIGCRSSFLVCPFARPRNTSGDNVLALSGCGVSSSLEEDLPVSRDFSGFLSLSEYCSISEVPARGNGRLILFGIRLSTCNKDSRVEATRVAVLFRSVGGRCRGSGCTIYNNSFGRSFANSSARGLGNNRGISFN